MLRILAFDIGGTKSEAALVEIDPKSKATRALSRERIATGRQRPYAEILADLVTLGKKVMAAGNCVAAEIAGLGIGLPGTVNPQNQMMRVGNSAVFVGKPLGSDLAKQLNVKGPIAVENDANCFAFAEYCIGAGGAIARDAIVIGVILGTGVGGGVIASGVPLRGARGGGGELGHTILHDGGLSCYCGQRGCVEQYLSGPALEASMARRLYAQIATRPDAETIFRWADQAEADPLASAVVKEYQSDLRLFLTQLTNTFDPHLIVLGGGLSKQKLIYECLEEHIGRHAFVKGDAPQVKMHQCGDSAGILGAALFAAALVS